MKIPKNKKTWIDEEKYEDLLDTSLIKDQSLIDKYKKAYFSYEEIWDIKQLNKTNEELLDECYNAKKELNLEFYRPLSITEELLNNAGFIKIQENISSRDIIKNIRDTKDELREDKFEWWAHPSGILATLNSCDKEKNNEFHFNSLNIYFKTELGLGSINSFSYVYGPNNNIQGSRNVNFQYNGSAYVNISKHITQDYSGNELIRILAHIQSSGDKIIPFTKWDMSNMVISSNIEDWVSLKEFNKINKDYKNNKPRIKKLFDVFMENTLSKIEKMDIKINGLSGVMAYIIFQEFQEKHIQYRSSKELEDQKYFISLFPKEIKNGTFFDKFNGKYDNYHLNGNVEINKIEPAIKHIEKIENFHCRKYLPLEDKKLLSDWLYFIISRLDKNDNKNFSKKEFLTLNMEKTLSNRCNIASIITAYSNQKKSVGLLINCIKNADNYLIKKWCTVPDISGLTLPLYIFNQAIKTSKYSFRHNYLNLHVEEILTELSKKCNASLWNMKTNNHTPLGIWFNQFIQQINTRHSISDGVFEIEDIKDMLQKFKSFGCDISSKYRWAEPITIKSKNPNMPSASQYLIPNKKISANNLKEAYLQLSKEERKNNVLIKYILEHELEEQEKNINFVRKQKQKRKL